MSANIKPTVAVMAAGLSERYGELKQIVPVHGNPNIGYILLEYAIYDALRAGFGKVVILIRKDFEEEYRKRYGNRIEKGADELFEARVEYVYQESKKEIQGNYPYRKKIWGTGYAALRFKGMVQEPFAVINADDFYGRDSFNLLYNFFNNKDYTPNGNVYALVGYRVKNVIHTKGNFAKAVCEVSPDGFLESIVEREKIRKDKSGNIWYFDDGWQPLDPNILVSTNLWGFNPTIFPELEKGFKAFLKNIQVMKDPKKECYLPSLVSNLLNEKKVKVLSTEQPCFGLTYKKDRSSVVRKIQLLINYQDYPDKLWEK